MRSLRSAAELVQSVWTGILDLVYPPKCLICEAFQPHYLCPDCIAKVTLLGSQVCYRCGALIEQPPCRECRSRELWFDCARSVAAYEYPLQEAIHLLKFAGHSFLAPDLSRLMVDYVLAEPAAYPLRKVDAVIPIPVDDLRLQERGFNQSRLLADDVAAAIGKPVQDKILKRKRRTPAQSTLSYEERLVNLMDVFAVAPGTEIAGRKLLLIDDVYTTGSTVNEAAKVLKEAGAVEVCVFTLARSL